MPRGSIRLTDFTGGVDYRRSPFRLEANMSAGSENVLPTRDLGAIRKRNGFTRFNSTAIPAVTQISGMDYFFAHAAAVDEGWICQAGTALYKADPAVGTWSAVTGGGGLTSNAKAEFASWRGRVYMFNGADTPGRYDGVSYSTAGWTVAPPTAGIIIVHDNRGFLVDVSGNPQRLQYSEKDDLENWPAAYYTDDMEEDGRALVGMASMGGTLYIFTEGAIWALYGNDPGNWVLRKVVEGYGSYSHRTISVHAGLCYFWSTKGPAYYDGGSRPVEFGDRIVPFMEDNIDWDNIDGRDISGVFFQGRYWLSWPKSGQTPTGLPNYCLVWDSRTESWWPQSNIKITKFVEGKSGEAGRFLYGASSFEGRSYLLDTGPSDAGSAISWHYRTAFLEGPELFQFSRLARAHLIHSIGAAGQTATLKWASDLNGTYTALTGATGTVQLDSPGPQWGPGYPDETRTLGYDSVNIPLDNGASGFAHSVELSGSDALSPVAIHQMYLQFEERPTR